ncbi:hypothetical protein K438DRAFT_2150803, partial [Mycena galopus ATCC 62051]
YYENFPDDLRRLQLLVAAVWLLDVTHLVLICQSCYHYLITSWGDEAALLVSTPELDLHLIFVGMATLVCQGFFLHRIWTFSKRNWVLTGLLSAACLVAFGLEVAISAQIITVQSVAYFSDLEGEIVAVFSVGGAGESASQAIYPSQIQKESQWTWPSRWCWCSTCNKARHISISVFSVFGILLALIQS